jgi:hypothetical protein
MIQQPRHRHQTLLDAAVRKLYLWWEQLHAELSGWSFWLGSMQHDAVQCRSLGLWDALAALK